MLSLCTCCRKSPSKSEDGDVYGVVNPSVPVAIDAVDGGGPVQFRNGYAKKNHDRSSLPSHSNGNGTAHTRVSAPGRALPQLPAGDLYSAIDKSRKDSIRFVDDLGNPTYESIDPDADSFVDPLYSKVGDPVSSRKDRKYDYPVFSGRHNDPGPSTRAPDETYQSASQIYGSEDPYRRGRAPVVRFQRSARVYRIPISPPRVSVAGYYYRSITSSARVPGDEYGDEDNSSAYDPGYAKVQSLADPRNTRLERKERELDQLYSKISRNPRDPDEQPGPRAIVDLPPNQPELPILAMFNPGVPPVVDNPSVESREPSYRYITVRENADRVRERLRQQGQLDLPRREHYYSTIGNEYDTIQGGSSTYGQVQEPVPVQNSLAIHTDQSSSYAPPPPTSPIPHRLDYTDSQLSEQLPQYATVNKKRNSTPGSTSYQSGWNPMTLSTATSFAGLTRSFTGTSSHPFGQMSPVASSSTSIQGIKEFMQKPLLPYGTTETVLGRKVVEERERIVEKRMSTGDPSTSQERVHHVEITRSDGPSADTIISGRRYRGSSAVSHEDPPSSARSNLPIPVNRAETSRLSDLAHQRKQRSLDSDNRNDQKSSKKRPEKNFLSSIYTANDYISPIDLTNGSERPWPISRDASPSSKRP